MGDARKRILRRGIKPISAFFAEGHIGGGGGGEGEAAFPEAERSGVNRLFIGVNMMFIGVNMMFIGVNRFFIGVNRFIIGVNGLITFLCRIPPGRCLSSLDMCSTGEANRH